MYTSVKTDGDLAVEPDLEENEVLIMTQHCRFFMSLSCEEAEALIQGLESALCEIKGGNDGSDK